SNCPTCGRPLQKTTREIDSTDELLAELRKGVEVYKSQNGTWHLTKTRDVEVSGFAVSALVRGGQIRRTYSNFADCYGTALTIDVEATLEARKKHGKHTPLVYVNSAQAGVTEGRDASCGSGSEATSTRSPAGDAP